MVEENRRLKRENAELRRVDEVLRVLGIPPSTYYDWRARQAAPSRRALEDAQLLEMIVKIRCSHEFAATYGSPRVWLALRRQGIRVGRKRVERIMREHGLQGAFLRKGWKGGSTKQNPRQTSPPDLVNRQFDADAPNRLWVADLTRIMTGEGCCGWPRCGMPSPTRSSAGPPPPAPTPALCSQRWITPCATATSMMDS
ncbi:IS3 family transposase [Amycolatopsis sp. H6(2020)]|nr:IS3 family transposase [Amycolatopsis sp. H6(2020)]